MAKHTLLLILILSAYLPVNALAEDERAEKMEYLFESISEEFNQLPDLDLIEFLSENPIYLPEAQTGDITALPGFTDKLAARVLYYSQKEKHISIDNIADSLHLTNTQKLLLEICTTMEPQENQLLKKELWAAVRLRSQHLLSNIKGYDNGNYAGKPVDFLQRYSINNNKNNYNRGNRNRNKSNNHYNMAAGLLTSKDPGETSLVDYYSGFISYGQNQTKIIAGDYYLKAGLGTILWNSFGSRKGIDVTPDINQTTVGIFPYRSTMDINFFRGISLNQKLNVYDNLHLSITGFASSVNRSATIDAKSNIATALYRTGYYRTKSEISKKNTLGESAYGGIFELESYNVTVGYAALNLDYARPVISKSSSAFYGKSGMLNSVYSSIDWTNITIAAEISTDANNNRAFKGGLDLKSKHFNTTIHYRRFSRAFRTPYGYMFGESSSPANESGLYLGIQWKGVNHFKLFSYADIYRTVGSANNKNYPVGGLDLFSEGRWKAGTADEFVLRLRYEDKTDSYKNDNMLTREVFVKNRSSVRIEWKRRFGKAAKLRWRIESSFVDFAGYYPAENGIMSYIEYQSPALDFLTLGSRFTYFSTDSYSSALWQFEYAMPGYMTTAVLSGTGYRLIIFSRIRIENYVDIWLRYAQTTKTGESTLGTGNDQIIGNSNKKFYIQIDARF